ncbi:unnamed protein product [Paramecium sonneborni]|uniref:Casein kinase I n=1 Tax=Paramecium sonneborni TaxID=65129 RepID=A0A8S1KK21_9CILI|nr:unnamed protein product [Paramecium sonneborni]
MNDGDNSKMFSKKLNPGTVIAGKYKLLEKIGAGSFGMVFKTQNLKNGELIATKFEKRDESQKGVSLLIREIKVLQDVKGLKGFPQLKFYGRDDHYNFFMESYLGMNLEQLMRKCNGKFSQNTVLKIGVQLLERVQAFHEKNLIHRDIKPENFTIGRQDSGQIYVIDFGLSKYFRDSNGKHIPFISNKGLIGTARYASANALIGNEQSRRDDIESLAYVLIYFFMGELPWQNIQVANKEDKYKKILQMKQNNSLDKFNDLLPKSLVKMLKISKSYEFQQTPDYFGLKKLLQDDLVTDSKLDWEKIQGLFSEKDNLSVSIDIQSNTNQFDDLIDIQPGLQNSMCKVTQQETKFINGRLDNSRKNIIYLEVPKRNSTILEGASSPVGTIASYNTSKMNHYEGSNRNFASYKQFIDVQVQSLENEYDDDCIPNQDDSPCLYVRNFVIGFKYKEHH